MTIRKKLGKSLAVLTTGLLANCATNDPEVVNGLYNSGMDLYKHAPMVNGIIIAAIGAGTLGTLRYGIESIFKGKDYKQ